MTIIEYDHNQKESRILLLSFIVQPQKQIKHIAVYSRYDVSDDLQLKIKKKKRKQIINTSHNELSKSSAERLKQMNNKK